VKDTGVVRDVLECIHGQMFADESYSEDAVDEDCDGIDDLWAWWNAAESTRKATLMTKRAVSRTIIRELKGQAIRLDDAYAMAMPTTVSRIRDLDGLADYLELSAGAKAALDPAHINLRGIRAYAETRGEDPDEIEARYFVTEIDENQPPWLKVGGMEWAPHWLIAAKLKHGDRVTPPERRESKAS
jgi:hypothetical protein